MTRVRFERDATKELENRQKHGVSFRDAQYAFSDPHRVIPRTCPMPIRKSDITVSEGSATGYSPFGSHSGKT
jgi:uncharacterized DUF497 family protein